MTVRQAQASCRSHPATGRSPSPAASHAAYVRWRRRQIAYRRWQPWADPAPVRDHVRELRRHGASYQAIAQAAGVSQTTVHRLLHGSARCGGQLAHRMHAAPASRLLAVALPAVPGVRDACGARRRLQGLVALGHCPAELARKAGITEARTHRLLTGQTRRVSPELHASVACVYEQIWNRLPAEQTPRQRAVAEAARRRAETAGWPPPMAFDDDRIDDPAYRPRIAWRRAAGLPAQPPGPRLCTTGPTGPRYPQEQTAGVTAAPDRCQASQQDRRAEGA